MKRAILLFTFLALFSACKENGPGAKVKIVTTHGNIVVRLYDETPMHRDNFLRLAESGSYDSVLFHRVINEFMIQAGDPDSKRAQPGEPLGNSSTGDDIDAEIVQGLFHKKGALAAAREGDRENPERKSSGSQFYLVQGITYSPEELKTRVDKINENRKADIYRLFSGPYRILIGNLRRAGDTEGADAAARRMDAVCDSLFAANRLELTPEQIKAYTTAGGSPHLDGMYTVFGEVVAGLGVIDRIAAVKTDVNDRPEEDVRIIRMVVMTR